MSEYHPWFANISPETGEFDKENLNFSDNRHHRARKDLINWMKKVNLNYHSPHKFRHAFAVYGIKNAKDIAALKAVSQNLMHSSITITDGICGILSREDLQKEINKISNIITKEDKINKKENIPLLEEIIRRMEN